MIEIGAGEGAVLAELDRLGFAEELYALDISSSGVAAISSRNLPRIKECKTYDGYSIPYEADRFDLAVLTHVVEHLEYPRKLIYEAARVAKHLFMEVPLEDTLRMSPDFVASTVGHINFYSPYTFRRLAQTCGLEVLDQRVEPASLAAHAFHNRARGTLGFIVKAGCLKVAPRLAPRLFTYNSAMICRKKGGSGSV